jgi:hypothetical protein
MGFYKKGYIWHGGLARVFGRDVFGTLFLKKRIFGTLFSKKRFSKKPRMST